MNILFKNRAVFTALFTLLLIPGFLFASYTFEGDKLINERTMKKMEEMGTELFQKTGVSTVVVAKEHLSKEEFLEIKNRYINSLQSPYVLWIFSKTYMDKDNIGINQMFHSKDLDGKFDQDSLFSPFGGTFTKVLTLHSKTDTTSAAFLNGFADLTDMIAASYGFELNSSIGNTNRNIVDFTRLIFYGTILFFLGWYVYAKFIKRKEHEK